MVGKIFLVTSGSVDLSYLLICKFQSCQEPMFKIFSADN